MADASWDEFSAVPAMAKTKPAPFKIKISDADLAELKQLIKMSKLPPETFENSGQLARKYGVTMDWMMEAKARWEDFDWRSHEGYLNRLPQFKMPIKDDDGESYDIHFVGMFSGKEDAIPLLFLHGWPGSFTEFLSILTTLKSNYTKDTLPYHVVVPSLPGYAFSSQPPLNRDFGIEDIARLMNSLMVQLGFEGGYVAQGGDIGSKVGRVLAAEHNTCKAIHSKTPVSSRILRFCEADASTYLVNYCAIPRPKGTDLESLTERELLGVQKATHFKEYGSGYAIEQASKPSTIGFVLASSPLALLAWLGEKFLDWTDTDMDMNSIIEHVSLYWLTQTFSRSIYPYREVSASLLDSYALGAHENPKWHIRGKPFGYSYFPQEIAPMPRIWVETTGCLTWFREHNSGGHFAAMERPEVLLEDVEAFIAESWR